MNAFECMYRPNNAYMNLNGTLTFMFAVLRGVLQGCPLSGWLFAMGMDPVITSITRKKIPMTQDSSIVPSAP